jgi:6-phosphogluconolactonase
MSSTLLVAESREGYVTAASHIISRELWAAAARRPGERIHVAISGGNTPLPILADLRTRTMPWDRVDWFWVDERFVPQNDARSNAGNARRALFDHVQNATIFPCPEPGALDLDTASKVYEETILGALGEAPVFDLVLLGIGDDGHTASLFPGEPELSETSRVVVPVPARGGREARLSLTAPVLQSARTTWVLAQGAGKREPIARARATPAGPWNETPAHLLAHARGDVFWLVDAAAQPA